MLSSHMLLNGQRSFLEEKVNLLEEELHEYKQKETKLNKLNESILQTYKENQHFRESRQEKLQKQNRQLTLKHRQEIRKLKSQYNKEKAQLQNENSTLKQKLRIFQDIIEQTKLENEKNLLDVKTTLQNKHAKHIEQIEKDYSQQIEELTLRVEELNQMNDMYKQYIERKQYQLENLTKSQSVIKPAFKQGVALIQGIKDKENRYYKDEQKKVRPQKYMECQVDFKNHINFNNQIYEMKERNFAAKKVAKDSKKLISELNTRINRAMRQIHDDKKCIVR